MKGVLIISNTKSRKYQLTFNNPVEHGFTHERINETMKQINWLYYCLCDEIGESGTSHTHLFFCCENAIAQKRIEKLFPNVHREIARGTCQQNRDYIRKEGKYLHSDKKETNILDTFEEHGDMPLDKSTKHETVSEKVLKMIENGCSNAEIIRTYPSYATKIAHLDKTRQTLLEEEHKNNWRDVDVTYIHGETATGKTRHVMEKYGYSNVYKISDYKNPFDNYAGQDVILFDEFRSSLPLSDMLQYLDGYPCNLPARFTNKVACYTKVYLISNIDLNKQYPNVQSEDINSWNAFVRRFNNIIKFQRNNNSNMPFSTDKNDIEKILSTPDDYVIEG